MLEELIDEIAASEWKRRNEGRNLEGEEGAAALLDVLKGSSLKTIVYALEMGIDPNGEIEGKHPLEWIASRDWKTAKDLYIRVLILTAYGSDPAVLSWGKKERWSCLYVIDVYRVEHYLSQERMFKGVQALGLLNQKGMGGQTLIHIAAQRDLDVLIDLLRGHVDFNAQTGEGMTPLHFAAEAYNSSAAVERLLESGANPNLIDKYKRTALGAALFASRFDKAAIIANAGGRLFNGEAHNLDHYLPKITKMLEEAKDILRPEALERIQNELGLALLKEL